jgi:hypothetical protein
MILPNELNNEIESEFDLEAKNLRSELFDTLKSKSMDESSIISGSFNSERYRGVTKNGKIW